MDEPEKFDISALRRSLEDARRDLLDLTPRNRLLNTVRRRTRSSSIEVLDELSGQIFRILVQEGREMSFLPRPESPDDSLHPDEQTPVVFDTDLVQPDEEEIGPDGVAARHVDNRLQTGMASPVLQKRLLRMYHDARTFEEEQGVNILFLALGFLRWYEDERSDRPRHAPLILVPVELDRPSARSRFRIRWSSQDIATNLSLQAKLRADFGIDLPDTPDNPEDIAPDAYFAAVHDAIETMPRWEVLADDMVLWFFSFAKLLMYRDLDPDNWPTEDNLTSRPLVNALLGDGFVYEPPLCGEDEKIDHLLPALNTLHVLDADSSQSLAIEEVKRGRNLIIQGPPGTGKSQTIANLIAAAVMDGKRVLFVAEKVAALAVVKRRLDNIGLGDMCLELHSNKAKKREVIQELGRTLDLSRPMIDDVVQTASQLEVTRTRLNAHCEMMHTPDQPSGLTPFQTIGSLVELRAAGVPTVEFGLPDAENWTAQEVRTRISILEELAEFVEEIGQPSQHQWRGVMLDASLPMDRQRLSERLPALLSAVRELIDAIQSLAGKVHYPVELSATGAARLVNYVRHLGLAPKLDTEALAHSVWVEERTGIAEVVRAGVQYAESREKLANHVTEAGWTAELDQARRELAAHGRSILRIFKGPYRRAMANLRGICVRKPPRSLRQRLNILDTLMNGQRAYAVVELHREVGERAFGQLWRDGASDWRQLASIESWDQSCTDHPDVPGDFRTTLHHIENMQELTSRADQIEGQVARVPAALQTVFKEVQLDLTAAFGAQATPASAAILNVSLEEIRRRLESWLHDVDSISKWIAYRYRDRTAREVGLSEIAERLFDGRLAASDAVLQFNMAYYELIIRRMMKSHPSWAAFDGLSHERVLEDFRHLDQRRIALARQQVAMRHYECIPRGSAEIGEVGIIRRELNKRRRHLAIRQLLRRAGNAVTRIKPVFMMSPLSIAQYVEPGTLEFDILFIDEASQVRPVEALGAAARTKQIVVVGDDKQLPPTRFFVRTLDDIDPEEIESDQRAGDLESILGLCHSQQMPSRMLRWHYRSRHHSLIAVSNHEFYDSRLFVIPSPVHEPSNLGLVFHHVVDAIYDRGGSATNRLEAEAVARAVMGHAEQHPNLTLGVGAFSLRQRDAIVDELERLRRENPQLEAFFALGTTEPFFVKNLENIQGDERDVIFVSVGFGPDASGYMTMNFGPVSSEGGERRLNVLITRARHRCEVFSSITHDQIDLGRATGRGPKSLKAFLSYAQTGNLDVAVVSGAEFDSPFEESVARAVAAHGYELDAQVGLAGFFIDLAVKDPGRPGRYLLGIECDGASYHSSRSARDRDRIRQQVLEDRGWIIHRIWSTDWFNRPEDQLRKVLGAVEAARAQAAGRQDDSASARSNPTIPPPPFVRRELKEDLFRAKEPPEDSFAVPYEEAFFRVPRLRAIHETPVKNLAQIIARIVKIEGPVHADEIAQRVTELWGLSRTGSRIQRRVQAALGLACRLDLVHRDGEFYQARLERMVAVRCRDNVRSSTLRHPNRLAPVEIRRCIELLLQHHVGATREEAIISTARIFGFRSTSSQLRSIVEGQVNALLSDGAIVEEDGRLNLPA